MIKKIKEITISKAFKRGLPKYGSVQSFFSVTIEGLPAEKEIEEWVHQEAQRECEIDPSWVRKEVEDGKTG